MAGKTVLEQVVEGLKSGRHPGDLAALLEELEDAQKKGLVENLSAEEAAQLVQEMEPFDQVSLIRLLSGPHAAAILQEMASDDAVDLLGDLLPEEAQALLKLIDEGAAEYTGLLQYPEDSAGGIMTPEYISLPAYISAGEAIIRLREIAPTAETIYYVYVVDQGGRLTGVLSLRDLISAPDRTLLKEIMRGNVISVDAALDQEEVARVVSKYDLLAVPVVDDAQRLLGIVTVDDVLDVLEKEATEDIYRLAGAGEDEGVELMEATVGRVVRRRLPWLLISMIGGILSGSVIGVFENTLEAVVVLALFIPVIMDMGGNVGTQSSTIFVRGVATGEIEPGEVWRYFFREIRIGLAMGFICGALVYFAALAWQRDPYLGVVVCTSMTATVTLAAIIGTLVPLLCNKAGIDPAITAGPFVTTIKDVTGLLIYFGVATVLLPYLR